MFSGHEPLEASYWLHALPYLKRKYRLYLKIRVTFKLRCNSLNECLHTEDHLALCTCSMPQASYAI